MKPVLRLIPLFWRARVLRSLIVATVAVAFTATAAWGVVQALQLSPEQEAIKNMGEATVTYMSPPDEEQAGPGTYDAEPEWLRSLGAEAQYSALVDLRSPGGSLHSGVLFLEVSSQSVAVTGRVQLDAGRWPEGAGECVSNLPDEQWEPTVGTWPLRLVGSGHMVFDPASTMLLCAPGTWGTWKVSDNTAFAQYLAATYHLAGDEDDLMQELAPYLDSGEILPLEITRRSHFLDAPTTSAKEFLAVICVAALLALGIPLVFSTRVASWAGQVQIVLSQAGISSKLVRLSGLLAVGSAAGITALVAATSGSLTALVVRPLLSALNGGSPLGPWHLHIAVVLSAFIAALTGALTGFLLGVVRDERRLSMRSRAAVPLSPSVRRRCGALGVILLAIALAVLWTSGGYFWAMSAGIVLTVGAGACLAPWLGMSIASQFAKRPASPEALAGRLIVEDGKRWATVFICLTAVVSVVCAVFVNITASVAAQTQLLASPVPRGMVLVEEPPAEAGGEQLLRTMEEATDTRHDAVLTRTQYSIEGESVILALESIEAAETVLGPLTDEAKQALQQGNVLRAGGADGPVTAQGFDGSTVNLHVVGYKPETGRTLALGFGYALSAAVPKGPEPTPMWVFVGLDDEEASRLADWPESSGNNVIAMHVHTSYAGGLAMYLTGGFALLALVSIPMCVWSMRREVEGLRPLVRGLDANGIPKRWSWRVLCAISGILMVVPIIIGLFSAIISTGLLELLYPPIFDLAGAGWSGIGAIVLVLLCAGPLAATVSARGVRKRRRSEVI